MGKKQKMITALQAKSRMSYADAKRVVQSRASTATSIDRAACADDVGEGGIPAADVGAADVMPVDGGPPASVEAIIGKVIELAQIRKDLQDQRLDRRRRETGSSLISLGDVAADLAAHDGQRFPDDRKLRDYLAAQERSVLHKIQTVMYAGRDRDDPLVLHGMFSREDERALAAQIASKSPLAEYLLAGLRVVAREGLDLEVDWDSLAQASARVARRRR